MHDCTCYNAYSCTLFGLIFPQDVGKAIEVMKDPFDHWRTSLNEIWNVAGIMSSGFYTNKNVPFGTSHYGYYMSSWHIIFGQSIVTLVVGFRYNLYLP